MNDTEDIGYGCVLAAVGCLASAVILALAIGVGAIIVKFFWNLT